MALSGSEGLWPLHGCQKKWGVGKIRSQRHSLGFLFPFCVGKKETWPGRPGGGPLHRHALLGVIQLGILPAGGQELLMGALLHDAVFIHYDDAVGVADGG